MILRITNILAIVFYRVFMSKLIFRKKKQFAKSNNHCYRSQETKKNERQTSMRHDNAILSAPSTDEQQKTT